jgi:protein TonB
MFDSALNQGNIARSFGTGATFSAVVHAALLGVAVYIGSRPAEPKKKDVTVTFVQAAPPTPVADAPPTPPPPPPKRGTTRPRVEKVAPETEAVKKPVAIVDSIEKPAEKQVGVAPVPPLGGPDNGDGVPEDDPRGVESGRVGGIVGGQDGSLTIPPPQNVSIPFGPGMNRPSMTSGRDPIYTKEALAAHVEGTMIVRCTINVAGAITNCRVLKELPHMKQAVLDALYSRRYTPVLFNGQVVNVDYVFNIRLVLPTR